MKIDGEFVEKCPSNFGDRLILSSVVDIARGLGKKTIAEFVATEEILRVCAEQGVDYVQGYHVGRPAPIEDVLPGRPAEIPASRSRRSLAGPGWRPGRDRSQTRRRASSRLK